MTTPLTGQKKIQVITVTLVLALGSQPGSACPPHHAMGCLIYYSAQGEGHIFDDHLELPDSYGWD